jgi:hypothetical protein
VSDKLIPCPVCGGDGGYLRRCWMCGGSGEMYQSETDEIEKQHRRTGFFQPEVKK